MALLLKDRVKETTTTTGTGTYTLAGAVTGFEAFSEIGDGNTTYYCCTDGTDFEVGVGTYTASGTTLARTTILQSSNGDAAVNWTSGSRTIFCTQPADKAVFLDANGNIDLNGGAITDSDDDTVEIDAALRIDPPGGTFQAAAIISENSATFYRDVIINGSADDLIFDKGTYTTTLSSTNPAAQNQTVTLPDATGTVALTSDLGTIASQAANSVDIDGGAIDGVTLGTNSAVTELQVDDLNFNGNIISSTDTNGAIALNTNGTGTINLNDTVLLGPHTSSAGAVTTISTQGTNDLQLNTNSGTGSGSILIEDGANGNISLTPNGTGEVDISKVDIDGGAIDGVTLGTNSAVTEAQIDDININDGTIESSNSFSGLILKVNGQLIARVQSSNQSLTGGGLYLYQNNPYITFEGDTADVYETNLKVTDPTANRDITLPDASGTVAVFSTAPTSAITDGNNGEVLTTDGSGGLSFTAVSGGGGSYANSDVDTHLNTGTASANEVLSWNGSDYDWVAQSGGGGGSGITTGKAIAMAMIFG